jgi:hypothetical protein
MDRLNDDGGRKLTWIIIYCLLWRTNTYSLELKYVWRTNMLPSLAIMKLTLDHRSRVLQILPRHLLNQMKQVSIILITLIKLDKVWKKAQKKGLKPSDYFPLCFDILFHISIYNIGSWNIQGFNGSLKHKVVNDWVNNHNLSLVGILETKIKINHMGLR